MPAGSKRAEFARAVARLAAVMVANAESAALLAEKDPELSVEILDSTRRLLITEIRPLRASLKKTR